jgi:hypothetical protein
MSISISLPSDSAAALESTKCNATRVKNGYEIPSKQPALQTDLGKKSATTACESLSALADQDPLNSVK